MPDVTAVQATAAAEATVDRFAPDAPDAIKIVAVNRLARWYESCPADGTTSVSFGDQTLATMKAGTVGALKGSGAAEILAPWRAPRARVVAPDDAAAPLSSSSRRKRRTTRRRSARR